jgi:hypothetical protein
MRLAVQVAGKVKENSWRFLVGKLKDSHHLKYREAEGRIILKWILRKEEEGVDWIRQNIGRNKWLVAVKL